MSAAAHLCIEQTNEGRGHSPVGQRFVNLDRVGVFFFLISRVHTSLFGCLALDVTELASPRAEKDLGLRSETGAGTAGATGSLASAP